MKLFFRFSTLLIALLTISACGSKSDTAAVDTTAATAARVDTARIENAA